MRERRRVLLVLALLLGGTATAHAQRGGPLAPARTAEAEARLAALEATLTTTRARLDSLHAVSNADPLDTLGAGTLTVRASRRLSSFVRAAVGPALADIEAAWGPRWVRQRMARVTLEVRAPRDSNALPSISQVIGGRTWRDQRLNLGRDTVASLREGLRDFLTLMVEVALDSALNVWLDGANATDQAPSWSDAYVELATSPAQVNRECAAGRLARCREALRLVPVADPRSAWYTMDDQRVVARAWWLTFTRRSRPDPDRNPCRVAPMTPACRAWADSLPERVWKRPLSGTLQVTLLRTALEAGGPESWERLLADTGRAVPERLAFAAGMSPDALLSAWHRRIIASRPNPVTPSPVALFGALLVVATALGLTLLRAGAR